MSIILPYMTQTTIGVKRDLLLFPRPADIDMFIGWSKQSGTLSAGHPSRGEAVVALRTLVDRLDLHPDFQRMVPRMLGHSPNNHRGDLYGEPPPEAMMREMYRVLRCHGYIERGGSSRTPLTGMQLYLLRSVSRGVTMMELGRVHGCDASRFRATGIRMYEKFGCRNLAHMVALAHQRNWLPDFAETQKLIAMSSYRMAPGYIPRENKR